MTNILQLVRSALQALHSLTAYIMEAENRKVSLMVISTSQSIEYYDSMWCPFLAVNSDMACMRRAAGSLVERMVMMQHTLQLTGPTNDYALK
jgi:hypothetical protein